MLFLTRSTSLGWRTPSLMAPPDGTRRLSTVTFTRFSPTLRGTGRFWVQRTPPYAQPAHPAVSCAIVSPSVRTHRVCGLGQLFGG